jgi:hypothetical protein
VTRICLDVLPLNTLGTSGAGGANDPGEPVQTGPGSLFPHPSAVVFENGVLNDLNASGQIAGAKLCSNGQTRAVRFEEGVPRDLTEALGAEYSEAKKINDSGVVIGEYAYRVSPGLFPIHFGFIWKGGVLTTLEELGAVSMVAINDQDQVLIAKALEPGPNDPDCRADSMSSFVGDGRVGPCGVRGLLWRDGVVTDLGTLGGAFTLPTGLDDEGVVTGISQRAGAQGLNDGWFPFVWQNGVMTETDGSTPTSPPVEGPQVFDGAGTVEMFWRSIDVTIARPVVFKDDLVVPLWGLVEGQELLDGEVRDMNASGLIIGIGRTVTIGRMRFGHLWEPYLQIVSSQPVLWSPDCYLGCCSQAPAGAGGAGAGGAGAGGGGN